MNNTTKASDEATALSPAEAAKRLLTARGLTDPTHALMNAVTDLLAVADLLASERDDDLYEDEIQDANWRVALRCLIEDRDIEKAREILEAAHLETVVAWAPFVAAVSASSEG
jgi:hypothetical protein